jgi:hypothetical protein
VTSLDRVPNNIFDLGSINDCQNSLHVSKKFRIVVGRETSELSFKCENKSKSQIARSGEYGGCAARLHRNLTISSVTDRVVWHRELSKCRSSFRRAASCDSDILCWWSGVKTCAIKYSALNLIFCGITSKIRNSARLKNCQCRFFRLHRLSNSLRHLLVEWWPRSREEIIQHNPQLVSYALTPFLHHTLDASGRRFDHWEVGWVLGTMLANSVHRSAGHEEWECRAGPMDDDWRSYPPSHHRHLLCSSKVSVHVKSENYRKSEKLTIAAISNGFRPALNSLRILINARRHFSFHISVFWSFVQAGLHLRIWQCKWTNESASLKALCFAGSKWSSLCA